MGETLGTEEKALIELRDVSVRYGQKEVLQSAGLRVEAGEILTVVGPNGAGKSTLLKVALGLLAPSSGQALMREGLVVGYMPQRILVDPSFPLTVRRFLSLSGRALAKGMPAVLEEVGAARVVDSPIQVLSGGEMQRVLLARALLRNPDLLVLDEPVQGVDVQGQGELFELITRIRDERNCAILMVSHDLHLVMASTDRVICLNRHICCTGTPEAVTQTPEFLQLFGPLAVKNLALYAHDESHRHNKNCRH